MKPMQLLSGSPYGHINVMLHVFNREFHKLHKFMKSVSLKYVYRLRDLLYLTTLNFPYFNCNMEIVSNNCAGVAWVILPMICVHNTFNGLKI